MFLDLLVELRSVGVLGVELLHIMGRRIITTTKPPKEAHAALGTIILFEEPRFGPRKDVLE